MTATLFERYDSRIIGENGLWFAALAPDHAHGRSTGYAAWGCRCDKCRAYKRRLNLSGAERLVHNAQVISQLLSKPVEPRTRQPARHPAVAPIARPLPDQKITPPTPPPPPSPTPRPRPPTPSIPPMINAVRERITTTALLNNVIAAYNTPEWTVEQDGGRRKCSYGDVSIVIASPGGPIIWLQEREVAAGPSELLNTPERSLPKAKGGRGGSTAPTSTKKLVEAVKEGGSDVSTNGSGHIEVTTPDGKKVVMPSTPSEYRSLKNTIAQLKKAGAL